MKIGVAKERRPNEKRCAVSPDTIKKYVGLGAEVLVEAGAGDRLLDRPTAPTRRRAPRSCRMPARPSAMPTWC